MPEELLHFFDLKRELYENIEKQKSQTTRHITLTNVNNTLHNNGKNDHFDTLKSYKTLMK